MRKCDSCLYGEKLYDGTLICQHIVSMQGREATQDYMICNRVAKCDFFLETFVRDVVDIAPITIHIVSRVTLHLAHHMAHQFQRGINAESVEE